MTDLETREFTLPIYWACYLINGDLDGLEEGEQEEIDAFVEKEREGKAISFCDVSEEPWFAHNNDANGLGGDVATFTAILHQPERRAANAPNPKQWNHENHNNNRNRQRRL